MDCITRLSKIVETSYEVVCQKIANGSIDIFNEASLQLHLGAVLKSLGQLYEFSSSERFVIDLEKRIDGLGETAKSRNVARCDITIAFTSGNKILAQAFLELKYFKASDDPKSAEATKDNRYGLFLDLENLERYRTLSKGQDTAPLCYEIAVAQNGTYANPNSRSGLNTGDGVMTDMSKDEHGFIPYASRKGVRIEGNYRFCWTTYRDNLHSLIVRLQ